MSETPLRCPFCNGEARVDFAGTCYHVRCAGCLAKSPNQGTVPDAVAAWNRRAGGWVRVEDGLPPLNTDGEFLLMSRDEEITIGYRRQCSCYYRAASGRRADDPPCPLCQGAADNPYEFVNRGGVCARGVTHWRPLPEGPKG
jgi:hypothetical protein